MFKTGDIVKFKNGSKQYEVESINYGIDGAYDFDEVYLLGYRHSETDGGWVCEFLLEKIK